MSQVTAVQVDFSSQVVVALVPMDSAAIPAEPAGCYYLIPGVDFPASTVVGVGAIWDGTRDPVFTLFAAKIAQIVTLDGAKTAREAAIDALVKANADYDAAVAATG